MKNFVDLDILVVSSSDMSQSASVEDFQSKFPFLIGPNEENYNLAYGYFLQVCKKYGLKAGLTTSADITGAGTCSSYWTYLAGKWSKVKTGAKSFHIFDKVSPTTAIKTLARKLLLSDKNIVPFNDVQLFDLFSDKLTTYKNLSNYTVPTMNIRSNKISDIESALKELNAKIKNHPRLEDFSERTILKDRFGAGGENVYKIDKDFALQIQKVMLKQKNTRFVIQPFLLFDKGYTYKENQTSTDIRLIFHRNKLIISYIRMAKVDDFRCNQQQGGELVYITVKNIPDSVQHMAQKILKQLNKPYALFSLDFAISNSGRAYLVEGNINPGINWDSKQESDEKMCKLLIRSIVKEIASSVELLKTKKRQLVLNQPTLIAPLLAIQ